MIIYSFNQSTYGNQRKMKLNKKLHPRNNPNGVVDDHTLRQIPDMKPIRDNTKVFGMSLGELNDMVRNHEPFDIKLPNETDNKV